MAEQNLDNDDLLNDSDLAQMSGGAIVHDISVKNQEQADKLRGQEQADKSSAYEEIRK